jgi:hypothetical protein
VQIIREDHVREIKKILVHYLTVFKSIDASKIKFPNHKYTKESGTPSTFVSKSLLKHPHISLHLYYSITLFRQVSLGIYNVDENTTDGMLEIIRRLKK